MNATRQAQLRIALGNPANIESASGDFSDLAAAMPKRFVDLRDATRIVTGADDLRHPMAGRSSGGVARSSTPPAIPDMSRNAVKTDRDDTLAPRDLRSVRQIELMYSLVSQLRDLDAKLGNDASEYTARMTDNGRWTPGRGGNASAWISRMIAKVRELKARPTAPAPVCDNCNTAIRPAWCSVCREATAPVPTRELIAHDSLYVRETKTGKPMPVYYAVDIEGVTKFYRVKAGTKPGWWWIDAQASDEFHPIKNVATKTAILKAIIAAGPVACMERYGQEIGSCGRCHRTLTDATSRARGIGPECEGKL